MNVGELIDTLGAYPREAPAYVSRDEEGNGFHEVHEVAELGDDQTLVATFGPRAGIRAGGPVIWPGGANLDVAYPGESD